MNGKSLEIALPKKIQQRFDKLTLNDWNISVLIFIIFLFTRLQTTSTFNDILAEVCFTANYAALVYVINYILLPRYFNTQKFIQFILFGAIGLVIAGAMEEGVIEAIFYPDTRGKSFDLRSMGYIIPEILPQVIVMLAFKISWDLRQQQLVAEELKREKLESELKFLKSQINPHVLFNNLNNIYSYSLEEPKKVPPMILKLSNIMRYMLYECDEIQVPLSKDLDYLSNYIELQKIQMEGRGEVRFRILGDPKGYRIAPLLLIAFVENCFKHSMHTLIDNINIEITVRVIDGVLDFFAENNFSTEGEVEDKLGGIGLDNVSKRLELLYPNDYILKYDQSDNEFRVNLRLNLL
ncbi:MAG: histidine kinase [Bacteroidota bacterium]